jgi:hypothetical protein
VEDLAARRTPELLPGRARWTVADRAAAAPTRLVRTTAAPPRLPEPRRADAERTPLRGPIDVNPRAAGGRRGVSGG